MNSINPRDIQILMASGMFLLGMATFLAGILVLVVGTWGRDLRAISTQTARLAQKGFAEDISGLVGNASTLLNTVNDLVHTATGIGVFLTLTGLAVMAITFLLALRLG